MKEIIDWEAKGNVVRFFLGQNGSQWGDDWNDAPYEHNAGRVYDEFVDEHYDLFVPFDSQVYEPCHGHNNSQWTKEMLKSRAVPCIVVVPADADCYTFEQAISHPKAVKYYFGDKVEK